MRPLKQNPLKSHGRLEPEVLRVLAGSRLLRDVCHAIPDAVVASPEPETGFNAQGGLEV